ncbi:MAG: hypothetical protein WA510_33195, partial [Acidobacteriaceae bacterium]
MDHVQVVRENDEISILAYRLCQWGRFNGSVLPPIVWCTSVWSRASGKWQAVFHQEAQPHNAYRL